MHSFSTTKEIVLLISSIVSYSNFHHFRSLLSLKGTANSKSPGGHLSWLHSNLRESLLHLKLLVLWSCQLLFWSALRLPRSLPSSLKFSIIILLSWSCLLISLDVLFLAPVFFLYLPEYFLFDCTSFICTFICCKLLLPCIFLVIESKLYFFSFFYQSCTKVLFIFYSQ